MRKLFERYREIVLYVIFGGLTTVVDFAISFILYQFTNHHAANIIAWIFAVAFAIFVNKRWVFESKRKGFCPVCAELFGFAGGRLLSLLMQEGIFLVAVDIMSLDKIAVKIAASVIVIITNYVLSKIVFKNGNK